MMYTYVSELVVYYVTPVLLCLSLVCYAISETLLLQIVTQACLFGLLVLISWSVGHVLFERANQARVDPSDKAVLITGCDTGFGHRLARKLDAYGFVVFAGVLAPDGPGARLLKTTCSQRLEIIKLDVTHSKDVAKTVQIMKHHGTPLWAVVNNAGILFSTFQEFENDVDVHQRTFDVNVFGMIRITKACLPLLRNTPASRIVNVASLAGRATCPMLGHYSMSKHAVRAFSNSLRCEPIGSDIRVVTIEPYFYKTNIINTKRSRHAAYKATPEDVRQAYGGEQMLEWTDKLDTLVDFTSRSDPSEVVQAMHKAVCLIKPKLFYRCADYFQVLTLWGLGILPETIQDMVFKLFYFTPFGVNLAQWGMRLAGRQPGATDFQE